MVAAYLSAMTEIATIAGAKVLFAAAEGAPLDAVTASDLLGEAWGAEADVVAVPVGRLASPPASPARSSRSSPTIARG
jgi:hypothetical protein